VPQNLTKGGFYKAIYALCLKFALCAHPFFLQMYSYLTPCICALHSTFCIVSLIFGALYPLHPALKFYEIHPKAQHVEEFKAFIFNPSKIRQVVKATQLSRAGA
jgi:hypothetical protein